VRRGTSGAAIMVSTNNPFRVHKRGDERVGTQGRWLRSINPLPSILPYVWTTHAESYEMELLQEPNLGWLDTQVLLEWLVRQLEDDIWARDPVVGFDLRAHQRKLLLYTPFHEVSDPAWTRFVELRREIDWDSLRRCLTHGDPTYDNVMFRDNSGKLPTPVLVDPLPATPAVPDLWSVDLGKLLQSCLGWEVHRYSDIRMSFAHPLELRQALKLEQTDNEWRATVYWCVVHLLRTLPYLESATTRIGVGRMIDEALLLL